MSFGRKGAGGKRKCEGIRRKDKKLKGNLIQKGTLNAKEAKMKPKRGLDVFFWAYRGKEAIQYGFWTVI
jgi:hypothetical protein